MWWLYLASGVYTLGSLVGTVVWCRRASRRLATLEKAEADRLEAENSTIIRRPGRRAVWTGGQGS